MVVSCGLGRSALTWSVQWPRAQSGRREDPAWRVCLEGDHAQCGVGVWPSSWELSLKVVWGSLTVGPLGATDGDTPRTCAPEGGTGQPRPPPARVPEETLRVWLRL